MRISEDRSGPLVTCTVNTGRSPVLTGELVPVDWHRLPVQVTNGPDRSSEVLINLNPEVDVGGGGGVQHTLNNCGQIFYKHTHTHTFSLNNCWICPW